MFCQRCNRQTCRIIIDKSVTCIIIIRPGYRISFPVRRYAFPFQPTARFTLFSFHVTEDAAHNSVTLAICIDKIADRRYVCIFSVRIFDHHNIVFHILSIAVNSIITDICSIPPSFEKGTLTLLQNSGCQQLTHPSVTFYFCIIFYPRRINVGICRLPIRRQIRSRLSPGHCTRIPGSGCLSIQMLHIVPVTNSHTLPHLTRAQIYCHCTDIRLHGTLFRRVIFYKFSPNHA